MQACLRRHAADCLCGHVGSVDHEHPDPALERGREGLEKIAGMDVSTKWLKVPAGTLNCGGFDVGGMHGHPRRPVKDGRSHRPRSAAEINHNRGLRRRFVRQEGQGFTDQ